MKALSSVFLTGFDSLAVAISFCLSSYIPIVLINVCFLKDEEKLQIEPLTVFFIGISSGSL